MSVPAPCLAIGQLLGSYRIIRTLGEGAMGEVYEVHDGVLDRRAALKVVPPSMAREKGVVARFRREAQAASQVRHAGVVHIFEYGVLPEPLSTPYFIMEYLEGETLHSRLKRAAGRPGGCLGLSCLPVLRQIAIALAAVHRRGFVHRDLKPAKRAAVEKSARRCPRIVAEDVDARRATDPQTGRSRIRMILITYLLQSARSSAVVACRDSQRAAAGRGAAAGFACPIITRRAGRGALQQEAFVGTRI